MRGIVPIRLYESSAAGKPVISTRLPGVLREFGEDHGIVYVDDPGDVLLMALRLVETGVLPGLGRKAREFAATCDWQKVTDEFESILLELTRKATSQRMTGRAPYVSARDGLR